MKKMRVIAFLLTLCMTAGMAAGCADKGGSDGAASENNSGAEIWYTEDSAAGSTTEASESELLYEKYEEDWNTEEYSAISENGFHKVAVSPLSTFSADVDSASYSNVRRMLNQGTAPEDIPEGAVRIEEFLNYFDYNYENPADGELFGITIDGADCPWEPEHGLIRIGVSTEKIDFSKAYKSNLVFLLDVSGSMDEPNKLPLLKKAFSMLVDNLGEKDRISIVTYAGTDAVVLDGVRGDEKAKILEAINNLEAGGGTNGSAGIETAYALAREHFIEGGNNRVILATDGDLNIGRTSESELEKLISEKKKSGVYLSVLGFGEGNLKDNKMETLADKGNGHYAYIDSLMEAKRVLVDEMGSTLVTVAEDVKFQVEFNPAWISEYRLLGYENRLLNDEDFTDDTKDAGEIGAGHTVTVLYEVVWADGPDAQGDFALRYQEQQLTDDTDALKEWATLKIRYKEPGAFKSQELLRAFGREVYGGTVREAGMLLEASAAEFGLLLRDSEYKGNASYSHILEQWENIQYGGNEEVADFINLVRTAQGLCHLPLYEEPVDVRSDASEGLSLEVVESTITPEGGEFLLKNPTGYTGIYGEDIYLEIWENGNWVRLESLEGTGWTDIGYNLAPDSEVKLAVKWHWMYGNLRPGTYRLEKIVSVTEDAEADHAVWKQINLTAEFEIGE